MKKRALDRLVEITREKENTDNHMNVLDLIDLSLQELNNCVNSISNNDFGFISKFKGEYYYYFKLGKQLGFSREAFKKAMIKPNDKVSQINIEYKTALHIPEIINQIRRPNGVYFNDLSNPDKYPFALAVKHHAQKAFDACIEKGYIIPAIQLLEMMNIPSTTQYKRTPSVLIPNTAEQNIDSFKKILTCYAKKSAYRDECRTLKPGILYSNSPWKIESIQTTPFSDIQNAETNVKYLLDLIEKGETFGKIPSEIINELLIHYNSVKTSCLHDENVLNTAKINNFREYADED